MISIIKEHHNSFNNNNNIMVKMFKQINTNAFLILLFSIDHDLQFRIPFINQTITLNLFVRVQNG